MKSTLNLETLVLVELICHLYVTTTSVIVTLCCQRLECLTDDVEMFVCTETFRNFRKKCNEKTELADLKFSFYSEKLEGFSTLKC